MTIDNASIKTEYRIKRILGGSACRRLLEMGFTTGSRIFFESRAPFGGAVLIKLRDVSFALADNVAALIEVQPL